MAVWSLYGTAVGFVRFRGPEGDTGASIVTFVVLLNLVIAIHNYTEGPQIAFGKLTIV